MYTQLSNEPGHKLQAVLTNELPYPTEPSRRYLIACQDWFEALSALQWMVATEVARAYYDGDKIGAETSACALPPAPHPD